MKSYQYRSLALTVLIHAAILALLMLFYISSPIPPWEEGLAGGGGGGSFVEFGELEFNDVPPVPTPSSSEQALTKEEEDELLTSDIEETVSVEQPGQEKDREEGRENCEERSEEEYVYSCYQTTGAGESRRTKSRSAKFISR
jgi:hypothetical protein